jgi:hypothetical protein
MGEKITSNEAFQNFAFGDPVRKRIRRFRHAGEDGLG